MSGLYSAVLLTTSVCMRLLGARSLEEVTPEMVNTANLNALAVPKGVFLFFLSVSSIADVLHYR